MDIAIRSVNEESGLTGEVFNPGDNVWSYLYRSDEGLIERIDILESEKDQLQLDGPVICKWGQRVKDKGLSEAEERRAALQSADEVFLSLFEEDPEGEEIEESVLRARGRLKFFLALQLERKRVLKPLGGRRFRHMPSKRELTVPELEITPELLVEFQEEISLMGGQ
jgi:gamma-glutamylcyclotransferase (GGCT)/AIG2-like uncharacterized protein YtfP